MRTRLATLVLVPFIVGLAACGSASSAGPSGCGGSGDIVIGVISPATGAQSVIVGSFNEGATQAATDINAKGNICGGRHIKIVEKDNQSDFTKDASLAKELVEQDKAVGIVFISDEDEQSAGQYLQQKGILTACACTAGTLKDTFSVALTNAVEAPGWKQYLLVAKHSLKPAVLYETSTGFGDAQAAAFCSLAQANHTPCVAQEKTTLETTDVTSQVADIMQHGADSILLEGFGIPVVKTVATARQAGFTGPILGTGTVATSASLVSQFVPAAARQGFVYVTQRTATQGDPQAATSLAAELVKSYGQLSQPLFVPMYAHDAVELLAVGFNLAHSTNGDQASKQLEQLNYKVGDGTFTLQDAAYSPQSHDSTVTGWLTLATADPLNHDGLAKASPDGPLAYPKS